MLGAALVVIGGKPASAGGGDADWHMPAELPAFGAVAITVRSDPTASPPAAVMLLEDAAGNPVYRFPPLPGTGSYAYFQTRDMAIADLDDDGQDDVVVIVEVMTGIGPSGAEPFPLSGVYLRRADAFERSAELEERLRQRNGGRKLARSPERPRQPHDGARPTGLASAPGALAPPP